MPHSVSRRRNRTWARSPIPERVQQQNSAPDLIASRPGKKLIIEIKRASEGRRDRVIPLLSQAALEAAYCARNLAGNPIPVAIVGANHISDSVSEEAKEFVRKRAPEVAVGLLDLRVFAYSPVTGSRV
jgi:hypothetical protein